MPKEGKILSILAILTGNGSLSPYVGIDQSRSAASVKDLFTAI